MEEQHTLTKSILTLILFFTIMFGLGAIATETSGDSQFNTHSGYGPQDAQTEHQIQELEDDAGMGYRAQIEAQD
jgi:hypothetical protein